MEVKTRGSPMINVLSEREREEVKEHWTNKEEEAEEVLLVLLIQQEVLLAGLDGSKPAEACSHLCLLGLKLMKC